MDSSKIFNTSGKTGIEVVGQPFHTSKNDLKNSFRTKSLDAFLKEEIRNSAGSYLIFDSNRDRLISSPGYAGGYLTTGRDTYISTTLRPLLRQRGYDRLEVNNRVVEHYVKHGLTSRLPLSSMFTHLSRLPPAVVAAVSEPGAKIQSYASKSSSRPKSFADAIEESVSALSYADDGVTLLFSGGADSTALYCAICETIGTESVDVVSVDIGANTNGTERARTVGTALDIDHQELEFGWPPTGDRVLETIETHLSRDFVNPLAPHHALAADGSLPKTVVSGQNFDAMSTGDMNRPQVSPLHYISTRPNLRSAIITTARNFQFTKYYTQSSAIQRAYSAVLPQLRPAESVSDPSPTGYIKGLYSTGFPHVVDASENNLINEEVDRVLDVIGDAPTSLTFDCANYYQYMANSSKVISTQAVQGRTTHLPAMWGPLASYYLGHERGAQTFTNPKHEIYSYIESQTGKSYADLAYPSRGEYRRQLKREEESKQTMVSKLLIRNREAFNRKTSAVIPLVDSALADSLRDQYSSYEDAIDSGLSFSELKRANRILNLEMILQSTRR